jgi:hypothetical protein
VVLERTTELLEVYEVEIGDPWRLSRVKLPRDLLGGGLGQLSLHFGLRSFYFVFSCFLF